MAFNKGLCYSCRVFCMQKPNIFRLFVTKKSFEESPMNTAYPFEDQKKILNSLNKLTSEQMRQEKQITFLLSEMICEHRSKFGPFLTLEELKKVKGVGPGRFKELCEKFHSDIIITAPEKNIKSKFEKPLKSFFSPEIKAEILKDISTATSISVCSDAVYFASVSKDLVVSNWNHIMLNDSDSFKQSAPKILEQALTIVRELPSSSIYLIETRSPRKISLGYMQILMFISQLQMALVTLLNRDIHQIHLHKVYHVSDTFSIKAFGLKVGGERVSGGHIIKLIEENQYSDEVSIHPDLWKHFHRIENPLYQERYSNCLLLGLAFFQHFLNKNMFQ